MSAHYLIGMVAGQRIAIAACTIESVIDITTTTPIPLAPPHVIGLSTVRSVVLTVIDVAAAIGAVRDPAAVRAAVVALDGHRYALRMARIDDVIATASLLQPVDESVGTGWHAASTGRIETVHGLALVVEPACVIAGAATACRAH